MTPVLIWLRLVRTPADLRRTLPPWPLDTRQSPAPRISLDTFFWLHRLAAINRLEDCEQRIKRAQITREAKARRQALWAAVEADLLRRRSNESDALGARVVRPRSC